MKSVLAALILACALGGFVLFMVHICSDTNLEGAAYRGQRSERASRIGKWMMLAAVGGLVVLAVSGCGTRFDHDPLDAYQLDPAAFGIPVTTIYSLGF